MFKINVNIGRAARDMFNCDESPKIFKQVFTEKDKAIEIEPIELFARESMAENVAIARVLEALFDYLQCWDDYIINFKNPNKHEFECAMQGYRLALQKSMLMIDGVGTKLHNTGDLEQAGGYELNPQIRSCNDLYPNEFSDTLCKMLDIRGKTTVNILQYHMHIWNDPEKVESIEKLRNNFAIYFQFLYYPLRTENNFEEFLEASKFIAEKSNGCIKFNGVTLFIEDTWNHAIIKMPLVSLQQLPDCYEKIRIFEAMREN